MSSKCGAWQLLCLSLRIQLFVYLTEWGAGLSVKGTQGTVAKTWQIVCAMS